MLEAFEALCEQTLAVPEWPGEAERETAQRFANAFVELHDAEEAARIAGVPSDLPLSRYMAHAPVTKLIREAVALPWEQPERLRVFAEHYARTGDAPEAVRHAGVQNPMYRMALQAERLLARDDVKAMVADAESRCRSEPDAEPTQVHTEARTFGSLTAAQLDQMHFAPVQYVVPGILPEGLCILAGKPKAGKSFAATDIVLAVGTGGLALGSIRCEQGEVLYLALEDSARRLQDRIRMLLPNSNMPDTVYFETVAPRLGEGLIEAVEAWIDRHPNARLIVFDTWVHIKPASAGRASAYDEDAQGLKPLHLLAKRHPGLALVVIHHTRKAEADDAFDTISGTHGLTGMCDTLVVLAQQGGVTILAGKGRDIEGYEKVLERDRVTAGWRIAGDAAERASTSERQALLDALADADGGTLTTAQIAKACGRSTSNCSHLLRKLAADGLVAKCGYGKWKAVQTDQTVQSLPDDDED